MALRREQESGAAGLGRGQGIVQPFIAGRLNRRWTQTKAEQPPEVIAAIRTLDPTSTLVSLVGGLRN